MEPSNINDELEGALVEVLFSIYHTFIKKQSASPVDSFQAETEHDLSQSENESETSGKAKKGKLHTAILQPTPRRMKRDE